MLLINPWAPQIRGPGTVTHHYYDSQPGRAAVVRVRFAILLLGKLFCLCIDFTLAATYTEGDAKKIRVLIVVSVCGPGGSVRGGRCFSRASMAWAKHTARG